MDMTIKNVKCVELNTKIVSAVLNTNIKDDLIECKVYFAIRATKRSLMKT